MNLGLIINSQPLIMLMMLGLMMLYDVRRYDPIYSASYGLTDPARQVPARAISIPVG